MKDKTYERIIWTLVITLTSYVIILSLTLNAWGYTIDFVGDIDNDTDSLNVRNKILDHNPDRVVCLGDLTYNDNLTWFKEKYSIMFGDKLKCIMGNHDLENMAEIIALWKESWIFRVDNILFVGFNTDGSIYEQLEWGRTTLNETTLANVTDAYIVTHRPCNTNASLVFGLCGGIQDMFPANVTVGFISGHLHVSAYTKVNGSQLFISGNGGAFHQACSRPNFMYCNDVDFGFLEFEIKNNTVKPTFYDSTGKVIYEVIKK